MNVDNTLQHTFEYFAVNDVPPPKDRQIMVLDPDYGWIKAEYNGYGFNALDIYESDGGFCDEPATFDPYQPKFTHWTHIANMIPKNQK